jgi:glycosyltransferase involved in cell wall biosynthesis
MRVLMLGCASASIYSLRKEILMRMKQENITTIVSVPKETHFDDLEKISNQVIDTPMDRRGTNIWHDLKLILFYYRMMKKLKPDCVLTYTVKCNLYGGMVAHFLGIPYLVNITGLGSSMKGSGFVKQLVVTLFRHSVKYSHTAFYQNKDNKQLFKNLHIQGDHEVLIPGSGVNLELNKYEDYPSEETIKFLFVARIMHEKGIDVLTDAIKILKKKYKNLELHVVGAYDENYKEKMKTWEQNDIVIYHGEQKNVHPFMKECHALIHPSFYLEGMSNVCLEAAATGRPVITTDMPGCRDTIENGKTGFICQPDNLNSLVNSIEKFLKLSHDEKISMGLAGRRRMEKYFDRNIVVNHYMDEIRKINNKK